MNENPEDVVVEPPVTEGRDTWARARMRAVERVILGWTIAVMLAVLAVGTLTLLIFEDSWYDEPKLTVLGLALDALGPDPDTGQPSRSAFGFGISVLVAVGIILVGALLSLLLLRPPTSLRNGTVFQVGATSAVASCIFLWMLVLSHREMNWVLGPAMPVISIGIGILFILAASRAYRDMWGD